MIIEGWASWFGNIDMHVDKVMPGAFDGLTDRRLPMLFNHDAMKLAGRWDEISVKPEGLWAVGTVLVEEYKFLAGEGALFGLSIGYHALDERTENGVRELHRVDLREVSLVALPSNSMCFFNVRTPK